MEHNELQNIAESFESKSNEIKSRRSYQGYSHGYGTQPNKPDPVWYTALVATDVVLATTQTLKLGYSVPLINYEIPE
jgi:hypothetical protein